MAKRHGIDKKTIAKWKRRSSTANLPTGPKSPGRPCCRLGRRLQRHGISQLPTIESDAPTRRQFKSYAIGYSTST